jgi:hypothetical protein
MFASPVPDDKQRRVPNLSVGLQRLPLPDVQQCEPTRTTFHFLSSTSSVPT